MLSIVTSTPKLNLSTNLLTTEASVSSTLNEMSDTQASKDNTALIVGGVVGGIGVIFLVVGVVALVLAHRRRSERNRNDGHSLSSSARNSSAHIPSTPGSINYSECASVCPPTKSHYDVLSPSEVGGDNTNDDRPVYLVCSRQHARTQFIREGACAMCEKKKESTMNTPFSFKTVVHC
jgi:hypothetical protein